MHRSWSFKTKLSKYRAISSFFAWILWVTLLFLIAPEGWAAKQAVVPDLILAVSNSTLQEAQNHPRRLVRDAVQLELANGYGKRPSLRYRFQKRTAHLNRTQEILETTEGDVACLVATDGHALSTDAAQAERSRLQFLRAHPALQEHRLRREQADIQHFEKILRALPDAFQYRFAGIIPASSGPEIHLAFQPNPHYQATDYESHALSGMQGDIWIDARQKRIINFETHLFRSVHFGLGILGYLDKGGRIHIQQAEVVPSVWSLTSMEVSLTGRALLVKPLQFDIHETATEYQRIANSQNYQQAIDLLLRDNCGITRQSMHQQ